MCGRLPSGTAPRSSDLLRRVQIEEVPLRFFGYNSTPSPPFSDTSPRLFRPALYFRVARTPRLVETTLERCHPGSTWPEGFLCHAITQCVRNRILAVLRDSPNLVQLSLDLAYETEFPEDDDEEIYDDVPERIALNRLERLKLCHVFCHSLLGCLKAPALQRTYLAVWMLEDVAMLERFFIASKPPLLDFKLNLIDYGDLEWDMDIIAQFQGIFAELSLLESMTIFSESTLVNNIRFWGLLTVRGGNILVPKLHTFSLQLSEDHPDNEYDRGYVVDFAESRWNHMPNFKICLDYESFLGWFEERFGEGSVDVFSASGKIEFTS
ncbi:hypothetical protein PNOK_0099400 [Pyrrhoderma noxium]|uniref:Uncharacterized protein n=1 Tax=Pyrrhoderma noxium TaxID=2282107 RepID=A0A286UWF3_9AGAM|nr:hypothetical protein PNOK_0099400 [Pyrrhoderma noxium]